MKDRDYVEFLQWAAPELGMRWEGFRKVRGQICKRIKRRVAALNMKNVSEYRDYLGESREEWDALDSLMRITISCFYRDKSVYDCLMQNVAPRIIQSAHVSGEREVRAWSVGCASGEEPYTLAIIWNLGLEKIAQDVRLHVIATDSDASMISRAKERRFKWSGLKDLPEEWIDKAFIRKGEDFFLKPEHRGNIDFMEQDVRHETPDQMFHLILCRNLVFTYFDESLQEMILKRILSHLLPGGYLVIGKHESLPCEVKEIAFKLKDLGIFNLADDLTLRS